MRTLVAIALSIAFAFASPAATSDATTGWQRADNDNARRLIGPDASCVWSVDHSALRCKGGDYALGA